MFLILLFRLLPCYFIVALGFCLGRMKVLDRETIATILSYGIVPVVVFGGMFQIQLSSISLFLPFFFWLIASLLCGLFYCIGGYFRTGSEKNLIGYSAGTGNLGFFGLPIAVALFGKSIVPFALLMTVGGILYDNTVGFFMMSKGNYSTRQSLQKLSRLPALYAYFLGLIANTLHFPIGGNIYHMVIENFQGAFIVVGLMLVGLGLARIQKIKLDVLFTALVFCGKFIVWPLAVTSLVLLLHHLSPHLCTPAEYGVMFSMSMMPFSTNLVVFSAFFDSHVDKAALTLLLSMFWVLFYIPLMLLLFHQWWGIVL